MNCPHCGVPLQPDTKFCPNCGNQVAGATQPSPQAPYQQPPQQSYQRASYQQAQMQPSGQPSYQQGYQQGQWQYQAPAGDVKTMDKNVFTWVFCFLIGGFGVDRFVRGQVGIGVCKLLFNWCTCGVWWLIDWIIAMVKAYGQAYKNDKDFTFVNGKYSR